ncbi:hypothetical protein AB4Y35_07370 [Paraburkholderia sp. EG286A]|uniref:hypothetical protein n=1 Tax=Paraburkholderia sp. EG286A TaxID=3237014 RepID=UPI0034D36CD3
MMDALESGPEFNLTPPPQVVPRDARMRDIADYLETRYRQGDKMAGNCIDLVHELLDGRGNLRANVDALAMAAKRVAFNLRALECGDEQPRRNEATFAALAGLLEEALDLMDGDGGAQCDAPAGVK